MIEQTAVESDIPLDVTVRVVYYFLKILMEQIISIVHKPEEEGWRVILEKFGHFRIRWLKPKKMRLSKGRSSEGGGPLVLMPPHPVLVFGASQFFKQVLSAGIPPPIVLKEAEEL